MYCYLYLISCKGFQKIGVADNPIDRMASLQIGCPFKLRLVCTCSFNSRTAAMHAETGIHAKLNKYNAHGEWFKLPKDKVIALKQDMAAIYE